MIVRCLECDCLHGWSRQPGVLPVRRHERLTTEDIWWCPGCGREHRTMDGTLLGQQYKRWEEVEEAALRGAQAWPWRWERPRGMDPPGRRGGWP